jgi:signal transduction histidine kinase
MGFCFPALVIYILYPSFDNYLIKITEQEALLFGNYISKTYLEGGQELSENAVHQLSKHIETNLEDFQLEKFKLFAPDGRIMYSTSKEEIGMTNRKEYFFNTVAQGMPFTEVVKKDSHSLEGQIFTKDVVETYIPVISKGQFIGAFEIYYDITEKQQALSNILFKVSVLTILVTIGGLFITAFVLFQLDKSMNEQKRIESELRLSAERLYEVNQELQDFAHIASHDLQEPLRKVTTFGERLKSRYSDVLDDRGRDYLERMQNAARRMQGLINGLLMYSRVTTKAKPFVKVDLSEVVQGVLSDLEVRIQETGGTVEVGELPTLNADPLQMRQLFQNLISNALKFTKKGTSAMVKVYSQLIKGSADRQGKKRADHKYYQFTVQDNGIGFEEEHAERIFGVFQRLQGRTDYEGSGIGLSVCKKIVERHGGSIEAKSAPGEGSAFIIKVPVSPSNGANRSKAQIS